uniref:Uncharacterized protein n=1 Tax=Meloidogyne hapla TaxID=6305 RepID=A0A1I8B0F0_MELHA
MRACLQRINRNKKHSMKDKEKTQVVVAGVGTFPASHLFPDNKQQIIPYGNRKEIEKVLERNPTPSDFNDFSTDYSTTTILTPKTQSLNKEENNKNEQIEIAKNLEKERRRLARLLRVMTNMGTENDLDIPSGNLDF